MRVDPKSGYMGVASQLVRFLSSNVFSFLPIGPDLAPKNKRGKNEDAKFNRTCRSELFAMGPVQFS